MLRKTIVALMAAASLGVLSTDAALAWGGHGRFHGGGFHHGFGFLPAFGVSYGAPYYYGGDYPPYFGGYYPYYADGGYYGDACHFVRHRVHTGYGWQWRSIRVCN